MSPGRWRQAPCAGALGPVQLRGRRARRAGRRPAALLAVAVALTAGDALAGDPGPDLRVGTFLDRLGLFSSTDEGVAAGGLLGEGLPQRYLECVRPSYPGRWGSFQLGVYTGSGFKDSDRNDDHVFEGRLSLRPLPETLPGLQLSVLAVRGHGNTEARPDWSVDALLASWQSQHLVATVQAEENRGVQSDARVDAAGRAVPGRGWSAFVELRRAPVGRRSSASTTSTATGAGPAGVSSAASSESLAISPAAAPCCSTGSARIPRRSGRSTAFSSRCSCGSIPAPSHS